MNVTIKKYRLAVTIGMCLFCATTFSHAQGSMQLASGFVGNINGVGAIDFSLTFNQVPDFLTVDQLGRQADSFQFYISTSTNIPKLYPPRPFASVIRGEEVHVAGNIRVRNDGPPDSDPSAGGWGSVRAVAPYALNGQTLTFSVLASDLNVSGPFGYALELYRFGGSTTDFPYTGLSGGPIPTPEPSSFSLMATGALTIAVFGLTKLCSHRRRSYLVPLRGSRSQSLRG